MHRCGSKHETYYRVSRKWRIGFFFKGMSKVCPWDHLFEILDLSVDTLNSNLRPQNKPKVHPETVTTTPMTKSKQYERPIDLEIGNVKSNYLS